MTNTAVPFVGIEVEMLETSGKSGVVCVKRVIVGSPAYKAGIQSGDLVLNVGRAGVNDRATLVGALANYKAGETITLKISREQRAQRVKLTLGERQIPALKFKPVEQHITP